LGHLRCVVRGRRGLRLLARRSHARAGAARARGGRAPLRLHRGHPRRNRLPPRLLARLLQTPRLARRLRPLPRPSPRPPLPSPTRIQQGIRGGPVSFPYPGTGRLVLEDVNLEFPPGSVVAIVGENGAGKTTLVKLLCRLYEPTKGRILIDGVDLARIRPAE